VGEELLTVPHIVAVLGVVLGVLNTSGVSTSDEVGDATVDSGGGVPQDLSGATVVHGRRPHGKDDVVGRKGGVIDESLVLLHTGVKRNIVVLAPATERVQKKDGVLVAELEELLTGILKKEDVTVVERVSNLEGVDGVGFLGLDLFVDLSGGHSVGVNTIVELNVLNEVHGLTRDEPVTLLHNSVDLRVLDGAGTEGSSGDLFLSVGEEEANVKTLTNYRQYHQHLAIGR